MGRDYFAIGVECGSHTVDIGGLWRLASTLGAAFVFTVGRRWYGVATKHNVPLLHFDTLEDLRVLIPYDCMFVGVDAHPTAVPLSWTRHPERAVYLLGADGLSEEALNACDRLIAAPGDLDASGSIVMYDRGVRGTTSAPRCSLPAASVVMAALKLSLAGHHS